MKMSHRFNSELGYFGHIWAGTMYPSLGVAVRGIANSLPSETDLVSGLKPYVCRCLDH
jgi:hypothetical protein